MSRIHYQKVTLENMVKLSDIIIIAKKSSPFTTFEYIDIFPNSKREYVPFKKVIHHYKVVEQINNSDGGSIDNIITVISANFKRELQLYKKYHIDNISKSPIYQRYNTKINIMDVTQIILFLKKIPDKKNHYQYFCVSSYEDISKKKEVLALLKK